VEGQGEPYRGFFSPFNVTEKPWKPHHLRNGADIPRIVGKASLVEEGYWADRRRRQALDAAAHSRL
jgi:hypothetical protein